MKKKAKQRKDKQKRENQVKKTSREAMKLLSDSAKKLIKTYGMPAEFVHKLSEVKEIDIAGMAHFIIGCGLSVEVTTVVLEDILKDPKSWIYCSTAEMKASIKSDKHTYHVGYIFSFGGIFADFQRSENGHTISPIPFRQLHLHQNDTNSEFIKLTETYLRKLASNPANQKRKPAKVPRNLTQPQEPIEWAEVTAAPTFRMPPTPTVEPSGLMTIIHESGRLERLDITHLEGMVLYKIEKNVVVETTDMTKWPEILIKAFWVNKIGEVDYTRRIMNKRLKDGFRDQLYKENPNELRSILGYDHDKIRKLAKEAAELIFQHRSDNQDFHFPGINGSPQKRKADLSIRNVISPLNRMEPPPPPRNVHTIAGDEDEDEEDIVEAP